MDVWRNPIPIKRSRNKLERYERINKNKSMKITKPKNGRYRKTTTIWSLLNQREIINTIQKANSIWKMKKILREWNEI